MNSSETSQSLRDPQQITCNMLHRFWSVSKKPFTHLFLTDNIQLDGMPTKIKLKIQVCFTLFFKFWEGTSVKSYKIQLPVLLFLVSHQFLYQQISLFYNFLELHWKLSENDFCHKLYFFNGFTQIPHPLNSQTLLSVTKVFCQFSLKWLLKYFYKYLLTKSCKSIFYVSVVNCYFAYIFKDSDYRLSGVLFKTYFKNSYLNTSISNYL